MPNEALEEVMTVGRLLYASPDTIRTELEKYGSSLRDESFGAAKKLLERAMLSREDKVIDIALAENAGSWKTLRTLYERSKSEPQNEFDRSYRIALQSACLSNTCCYGLFATFPEKFLGEQEAERIYKHGDDYEVLALFGNPRISSVHLKNLFKGSDIFAEIDDQQRRRLVIAAASNPRINEDQSDEHGPDMGLYDIQGSIYEMLSNVPANKKWISILSHFFERANPFHHRSGNDDSVIDVLRRWATVAVDDKDSLREGYWTELSRVEEFACELASRFGYYTDKEAGYKTVPVGSPSSEEVFLRCAYYGNATLSIKEMNEAMDRDGDVYTFAVLQNNRVLADSVCRKYLESSQLGGDFILIYRTRCKQMHEANKYFDPTPVSELMSDDDWDDDPSESRPNWSKKLETDVGEVQEQLKNVVRSQNNVSYILWIIAVFIGLIVWKIL